MVLLIFLQIFVTLKIFGTCRHGVISQLKEKEKEKEKKEQFDLVSGQSNSHAIMHCNIYSARFALNVA